MTEDKFDRQREAIWGTPGFLVSRATVVTAGDRLIPGASWIIETVKNEDGWGIFLQSISADGGQRIVLPGKVVEKIYRQYTHLCMRARSERAKRGVETRKRKAVAEAEKIVEAAK